jgi:hypothetical protein
MSKDQTDSTISLQLSILNCGPMNKLVLHQKF